MTEKQPIPGIGPISLALRTIIERRFVSGLPSENDLTKALPLLTLERFGGPATPTPEERGNRLTEIRSLLGELAPQLGNLPAAELEAARIPFEPGPKESQEDFWKKEAQLLADAAATIFQLTTPKPKAKPKRVLFEEASKLYENAREERELEKTDRGPQWFERSRQLAFLSRKLAEWIINGEDLHRKTTRSEERGGEPPPTSNDDEKRQDVKETLQDENSFSKPKQSIKAHPPPQRPQASPRSPSRRSRTPSTTKKPTTNPRAVCLVIAAIIVLGLPVLVAVSLGIRPNHIFDERLRSSTSPEIAQIAALDCMTGQVDQWESTPTVFPDDPARVLPGSLTVSVGSVDFSFGSLNHHDRQHGYDSWDFVFTPRDETDELTFIFRQDQSSGGGYGYVINGPPGNAQEPTNGVCALLDFHKTPLGEFLKDRANDEGLVWAAPSFPRHGPPRLSGQREARGLFKIEGNDAPKFAWRPWPLPQHPTEADARSVSVFVCEQTVLTCRPSTPRTVRFRLTGIHHEDRRTGLDTWDFVFKPYRGNAPIRTPLQVVYRANTDGARVAAIVWGDPGDDSLPANVVDQLNGFSSTSFAEDFLHKLQNDDGQQWAERSGLETTARATSLVERATGGG